MNTTINREVKDHHGNTFINVQEMCDRHQIDLPTFKYRIDHGWTLGDALTKKHICKENNQRVKDHLGNCYPSIEAMCKAYNINPKTFASRMKRHMGLEKSLTMAVSDNRRSDGCYDHLGNKFPSVEAMCRKYNMNSVTYYARRKRGKSLEESLTNPVNRGYHNEYCYDHHGNKFNSVTELCKHYHIEYKTFGSRMRAGWSLKDALETPVRDRNR